MCCLCSCPAAEVPVCLAQPGSPVLVTGVLPVLSWEELLVSIPGDCSWPFLLLCLSMGAPLALLSELFCCYFNTCAAKFNSWSAAQPWHRLPAGVPSLEGFGSPGEVALGDVGQRWPRQRWGNVGLDALGEPFQFNQICDFHHLLKPISLK